MESVKEAPDRATVQAKRDLIVSKRRVMSTNTLKNNNIVTNSDLGNIGVPQTKATKTTKGHMDAIATRINRGGKPPVNKHPAAYGRK